MNDFETYQSQTLKSFGCCLISSPFTHPLFFFSFYFLSLKNSSSKPNVMEQVNAIGTRIF